MKIVRYKTIRNGIQLIIEIDKGCIGDKKGWSFSVYFDGRKYPNLISALYKTRKETKLKMEGWLFKDKLDTYGSAE